MKSTFVSILFLCLFCLVSVTAQDLYSSTPDGAFSPSLNYEVISYEDTAIEYTDEFILSVEPESVPISCDIDSDGIKELVTYDGNTVTFIHTTSTGFETEKVFSVTPVANTTSTAINWIACTTSSSATRLLNPNQKILAIHQGTTDGQSEISFIAKNPELGTTSDSRIIDYGDGFTKVGAILNARATSFGVSCDSKDITIDASTTCGTPAFTTPFEYCAYGSDSDVITRFRFTPEVVTFGSQCDDTTYEWNTFLNANETVREYDATDGGTFTNLLGTSVDFGIPVSLVYMMDESYNSYYYVVVLDGANDYNVYHAQDIDGTLTFTDMPVTPTYTNDDIQRFNWVADDIDGDGDRDACVYGWDVVSGGDYRAKVWCGTTGGTELVDYTFSSGDINRIYAVGFFDFTKNGDKEVVVYRQSNDNANNDLLVFLTDSGFVFPSTTKAEGINPFYTMNIMRVANVVNDTEFVIVGGENIFRVDTSTPSSVTITEDALMTGIQTYDMGFSFDFDYDYIAETGYIDSATGAMRLYYHDALPLRQTVTLVNESRYASGYFGFDPISCQDSPITIQATQCDDGEDTCTYTNTLSSEKERVCTTCGGTVPLFCGNFSFASPKVLCEFGTVGDKEMQVYIETESKPDFPQAVASFTVEMSTDLTCNQDILILPATFTDPDAPTTPDTPVEEPDSEKSDLELYYDDWLDTLDESVPRPLQLIASIIIMVMMAVWVHGLTNGNNYMTIMGSLFGAGISVALGLLAIELVLIIGIGLLVFVFIAYKMERLGGR
jgi:hypothetical protein